MSFKLLFNELTDYRYRIAETELMCIALQVEKIVNCPSKVLRCDGSNKLFECHRGYVMTFFDVADGKQRPKYVEVFLEANLIARQIFPGVATSHVTVVVAKRLGVKGPWRQLSKPLSKKTSFDVLDGAT